MINRFLLHSMWRDLFQFNFVSFVVAAVVVFFSFDVDCFGFIARVSRERIKSIFFLLLIFEIEQLHNEK